ISPAAALPSPSQSLVDQLLREGIESRDRGDTTTALARFEEALDSEPNNTAVLEEVAKTYESMQLLDRANQTWRRIQEMGPSAGAAYELADRRLKLGVPVAGTTESGAAAASVDVAPHKDVGGNRDGSVMGISEVKTTETPDPDAEKNLTLEIGIKKQSGLARKLEAKVLRRIADNENTWVTLSGCITTMTCKRYKQNRRGSYSIFPLRRVRWHNDTIRHSRPGNGMSFAAICMHWRKL